MIGELAYLETTEDAAYGSFIKQNDILVGVVVLAGKNWKLQTRCTISNSSISVNLVFQNFEGEPKSGQVVSKAEAS
jgi:hypothetical protein